MQLESVAIPTYRLFTKVIKSNWTNSRVCAGSITKETVVKRINLITVALTLVVQSGFAQDAADPYRILFTNVNVFDGVSESLEMNTNVLVEDNLIAAVGPSITLPEGAEVIDGGGRTLMPGLADMHTHISTMLPLDESRGNLHPYAHGAMATLRAEGMLMNGYTTIRDTGGAANYLRLIIDEGVAVGPRIYPSENWITTTSGHGDFRTLNEPHPSINGIDHFYDNYVSTIADGVDETTRAVRETFRRGATQIKLFSSGGMTSRFDPLHSGPNAEEIRAAVKVAERWDTYVMTHSFQEDAIRIAIDNGVKSIEHAPWITDDIAKVMIEKGIFLAVGVGPVYEVDIETARKQYNPASFKKWLAVREAAEEAMNVFSRNPELKIVLGSDLLASWQTVLDLDGKMNNEFTYFGKAIGNFRTLRMATSTAGELNLMTGKMNPYTDGILGVIRKGAYADILLVNGNPMEDIELMTDPDKNFDLIMKDGKIYKNTL